LNFFKKNKKQIQPRRKKTLISPNNPRIHQNPNKKTLEMWWSCSKTKNQKNEILINLRTTQIEIWS